MLLAEETTEANLSSDETEIIEESQLVIKQTTDSETNFKSSSSLESAKSNTDEKPKVWIPSAVDYDWIQLTSNEWLKGEIKGMYKNSLEFDSDKLTLLTIDWKDVSILRSHRVINVNIEDVGATSGILEVTNDNLKLINDYESQTYDRSNLISFAPGGRGELDLWSVKMVLSLDLNQGNTDQIDYSARLNVKRRAPATRFLIDYIGNVSKVSDDDDNLIETINNHRLNTSFDYYKTRYFFYTLALAELYSDPFTNIDLRTTVGAGLGYTVIKDSRSELSFSGGPAYMKTDFVSVAPGQNISEQTPAAAFKTNYDFKITKTLDFTGKYNIQVGNVESGGYTHHIILTVESEIIRNLDIDISFIWDRTSNPTTDADGTTPVPNNYHITLGISYTY